jgi:outer membrane receptor for monomeric catechols
MQAAQTERKRAEHSVVGYLTGAMSFAVASAPAMADAGADVVTAHLPEQTVTGSAGFKTDEASGGKFTAPLLDTPKSVTVIPAEVLQDSGSVSLTEALRTVPGIAFGAGEGGNPVGDRPFIRGYDAQASTFLDGLRDIGAQSRDMFNVESVEVVKGPSGAYEGRGSAGGAINLVSKAPKLETFTEGTVSVGNAAYKRATADGNYQIGEHAAFRLNAMFHDAGVPGRDVTSFSRWGVAPSIAFGLGTPTRATLSTYHLQSNDTPDTGIPYNNGTFNRRTDGRPQLFGPGDGAPVGVDRSTYYGLSRDFRRDQVDMGTLVLEHDFSNALKLRNTTRPARRQPGQHLLRHGLAPRQHALFHRQHDRQPDRADRQAGDRRPQAQLCGGPGVLARAQQQRHLQRRRRQQPLPERHRRGGRLQLHEPVQPEPERPVGRQHRARQQPGRDDGAHAVGLRVRHHRAVAALADQRRPALRPLLGVGHHLGRRQGRAHLVLA